jgi:hypothetical protein
MLLEIAPPNSNRIPDGTGRPKVSPETLPLLVKLSATGLLSECGVEMVPRRELLFGSGGRGRRGDRDSLDVVSPTILAGRTAEPA